MKREGQGEDEGRERVRVTLTLTTNLWEPLVSSCNEGCRHP